MNRRTVRARTALTIAIIGLGLGVAWQLSRPPKLLEPTYSGRRLTYWLKQYNAQWGSVGTNPLMFNEARDAIEQIGTNGVPVLLNMLQQKDSTLLLKLTMLLDRTRIIPAERVLASEQNHLGEVGFRVLGSRASNAVPHLIAIFNNRITAYSQTAAGMSLADIGFPARPAVPALLHALTNADESVREAAIYPLTFIPTDGDLVVPALTKAIADTNRYVSKLATKGIMRYSDAIDMKLKTLFTDAERQSVEQRREAMISLSQSHVSPDLTIPRLLNALREGNSVVKEMAAYRLGSFGSNAQEAVPVLMDLLSDTNASIRESAKWALKQSGANTKSVF